MLFEFALPFSIAQVIVVSENDKVSGWNFVKFSKIHQIFSQTHLSEENLQDTMGTFCSILKTIFCNLLNK